jgi:hypothetical protein
MSLEQADNRQVTDLERKLRHAKLEVSNLQSQMQRQRLVALDDTEWSETAWRRNSNESDAVEPFHSHDFRRVREEIIRRSPGLFNVPPPWRESLPDPVGETVGDTNKYFSRPTLPPREFAQHVLQLFENEVSAVSPYVELQPFLNRAKDMYEKVGDNNEIPTDTSRSWLVLLFATMALTCLCIQDETILQYYATEEKSTIGIGRDLADAAAFFFWPVTKTNTLDDVRGALTLSVYFKQMNELGAANIWLGLSFKIAQYLGNSPLLDTNLGFHRYSQGLSREEEEIRANAWWDIYLFDRYPTPKLF